LADVQYLILRNCRKERNRKMRERKGRYTERKTNVDNKKCKDEIEMKRER
jgi:major membrane immunogen (membrane-anchored lipoprotein)